ncbi:MAG: putative ABC transport system permease protein [Dinoroseobacter sp.]
MSPLNAKLGRDLWHMKGQALAIALVIATGVMMLVMMTGLVNSLSETKRAYYERYRLADVYAPVVRAPDRLMEHIAALPGVASTQARVTGTALVNLPGLAVPIQARALSLPDRGETALNAIYLRDGRRLNRDRADEILLLESFAKAHDLRPGDALQATMNGARRTFDIVGLAQSPEFLYVTAPGELVPDDARFGVIWMSRSALSAAYGMSGAFNEAIVGLERGASQPAIFAAIDRVLDPYGGLGAYGLADLLSDQFVTQEIAGLEAAATSVPPLFLAVAAFLLYIVIGRMVQSEREEIGLMKAFGYTNIEVGAHYLKLVLVIALGGAVLGSLFGILAGRALVGVYLVYFKFPFLVFQLDPGSFVIGFAVSVLAASAGGALVLRHVFALTPAAAMRPPAPADYSRTGRIGAAFNRYLDQPSRMVLRRLTRQPGRMLGAVAGLACGMGLSVAMISIFASFERTVDLTFTVVDRSDVTVSFTHAVSDKTLFELARMDGVLSVEPTRSVPAILRNGRLSHRGALTGMAEAPRLYRALDADQSAIALRGEGIVLSRALSEKLDLRPGQMLSVEVRTGAQPVLSLPVVQIADPLLGAPAYLPLDALNRVLGEPGRVSGAYLSIDSAKAEAIYARLRDMPTVAGVSLKAQARDAFQWMMNEGAGATRYVMAALAFIITFGIVYNSARIAQAERARDLASLRVLGFTKGEAAFVLLGELAVVTLAALPLGAALGYGLSILIAQAYSTEIYQIPALFDPPSYGSAVLVVVGAALASGWAVKRDLDRTDLVATLKTRE